jgi:hypothetical protein
MLFLLRFNYIVSDKSQYLDVLSSEIIEKNLYKIYILYIKDTSNEQVFPSKLKRSKNNIYIIIYLIFNSIFSDTTQVRVIVFSSLSAIS